MSFGTGVLAHARHTQCV